MRERSEPFPLFGLGWLPWLNTVALLDGEDRAARGAQPLATTQDPTPEVFYLAEDADGYMVAVSPNHRYPDAPRPAPEDGGGHTDDDRTDDQQPGTPSADTDDVHWTPLGADASDGALLLAEIPAPPTAADLAATRAASLCADLAAPAALPSIPERPTEADLEATRAASLCTDAAAGAALPAIPDLPPAPVAPDTVWEIVEGHTVADGTIVIVRLRPPIPSPRLSREVAHA